MPSASSIARTRARNFYYSFLLLSREQRDAMCAIYAFMRYCDDISEGEGASREGYRAVASRIWICALEGQIRRKSRCGRLFTIPCSATAFRANISTR